MRLNLARRPVIGLADGLLLRDCAEVDEFIVVGSSGVTLLYNMKFEGNDTSKQKLFASTFLLSCLIGIKFNKNLFNFSKLNLHQNFDKFCKIRI